MPKTAELLAHTLTPAETLLDVMPVRYRRRSSSLILTNQRLWCVCESLRLQRPSTQDLFLFLSELEQIEIAGNGLRVQPEPQGGDQLGYQSDYQIYFNVGESQNLEILLSYFTRVVRRPVIAETTPLKIRQAAGLGLVASLVLGVGWTVAGGMDVFLRQVPLEQQAVEPQGLDAGNLNAQSLNAQSLKAQTPTVETIALPSLATSTLADSHPKLSHCLDRFNQSLNPNGYAALNRVTQTLMIRLEQFTGRYANGVEFDALAEQMAQEAFASCDRTSVNQVRVEGGRYSFFRGRNAKNYE
ncbi:MAG: hypothetical protein HC857_15410 [Synechococcales cyanobacterium RU_4_20]|nr:hypothetical protein [Synechococcales cyanobacterium RU_4_20]